MDCRLDVDDNMDVYSIVELMCSSQRFNGDRRNARNLVSFRPKMQRPEPGNVTLARWVNILTRRTMLGLLYPT